MLNVQTPLHNSHVHAWRNSRYSQASAFLRRLDPEAEKFTFQTFDDTGENRSKLARKFHGAFGDFTDELEGLQRDQAGVFVTVNETDLKGRQTSNIKRVRAVFVDLDGAPLQQVLEAGLEPHIVVESSPGKWHCYWLTDDCPLDQFSRVQVALAMKFSGDASVKDLPRVLRLPGFRHFKGVGVTSELHEELCNDLPPYDLAELIGALDLDPREQEVKPEAATNGATGKITPGSKKPNEDMFAAKVKELGHKLRTGNGRREMVKTYIASKSARGMTDAEIRHMIAGIANLYFDPDDPIDEKNVSDLVAHFRRKDAPPAWPDPVPLPDDLPPVAAFDLDLLPDSLRPWIQDIAERVQCPPDFPAVGAIISLAAVVGRKIGIRPKRQDDWLEVPNLWGAIVGRPGVLKSPALREALRPLKKLEALAFEGFEAAKADWKRANELHKMKREAERSKIVKALKKPGAAVDPNALADEFAEDEPQARRYVVNDCTVEALGEILKGNPNGTLAYRDELIGLLKSLDKEGNEGARGFFLSAWSGTDAYTFDRIGRGLNMRIEACCLSLLGSIQPSVIGGYLRQAVAGGGGDGLLSRFQLLVWPDVAGDWKDVDRWPDTEAKAKADATFERLDLLDPASIGATVEDGVIPYLRFDSDAQGLFSEWRAGFELRIRGGNDHAAFEAHLAKYRKLVPALALLIHLADSGTGAIGETSLLKALSWAEYLETHARRAYASVTQAEAQSARALLSRIRRAEVPNPFVPRDVYLKHWACLSRPEEVHEAVRLLADLDYLRREEQATGGRPKGLIWINPKVQAA